MAFRDGNRDQLGLLPPSVEEYVGENDPVRVYDALIDCLSMTDLGIEMSRGQVGNPEYNPKTMLKLLVFGYSYGIKSSRKLERECHHNLSFIWLTGGLRPDHKTIAEFRRKNINALKKVLKQCVKLCVKLDLIDGNALFVDGTKIRANASRYKNHTRDYYEKQLVEIEKRIAKLLEDCEAVDQSESGQKSYVRMNDDLAKAGNTKKKVEEALKSFEGSNRKTINITDPDCALMKSIQGSHASYNVQGVVDDKKGLIVHAEAVGEIDIHQFANQIKQANAEVGNKCEMACADAGYSNSVELEKVEADNVKVVVPSRRQALHGEEGQFSKSHFQYDKETDRYTCPEGHKLRYEATHKKTGRRHYKMADTKNCQRCQHFGKCTNSKNGRKIMRLPNEDAKQRFEILYEQNIEWYEKRKTRCEHPFGHIKRNLKTDAFHLRGKDGVQAETSVLATCFNVSRMITILGIGTLMAKLAAMAMTIG